MAWGVTRYAIATGFSANGSGDCLRIKVNRIRLSGGCGRRQAGLQVLMLLRQ